MQWILRNRPRSKIKRKEDDSDGNEARRRRERTPQQVEEESWHNKTRTRRWGTHEEVHSELQNPKERPKQFFFQQSHGQLFCYFFNHFLNYEAFRSHYKHFKGNLDTWCVCLTAFSVPAPSPPQIEKSVIVIISADYDHLRYGGLTVYLQNSVFKTNTATTSSPGIA